MGALNILRGLFRGKSSIGSASARTVSPRYGDSGMDRAMMWAAYMKCAPLNAAINAITMAAVSKGYTWEDLEKDTPMDRVDEEKLKRAQDLIDHPGGLMNGEELLKSIIMSLLIFGDAWVEVQYKTFRTASGQVIGKQPFKLWMLPPQEMFIKATEGGEVVGYVQRHKGKELELDKDQVLHIYINKGPGALYGTPQMVAVKNLIATWLRAVEYNHDYYFMHGRPKALINLGTISQPELDRLTAKIQEDIDVEGGGYTFLNTPELNVQGLADSHKDMEFNESLRYAETRILSVYHTPQIKIGISETGGAGQIVGSTQVGSFFDMVEALNRTVQSALNSFLELTLALTRHRLKIRSPRPLIDPALVQGYATLLDKQVMVPNEVRELMGLEPLPGGDEPISAPSPMPMTMNISPPGGAAADSPATAPPIPLNRSAPEQDGPVQDHPFNEPGAVFKMASQLAAESAAQYAGQIKAGIRQLYEQSLRQVKRAERRVVEVQTFKQQVLDIVDQATADLIERSDTVAVNAWIEGEGSVLGYQITPDQVPQDLVDSINEGYGRVPIKTFSEDLAAQITDTIDTMAQEGQISLYQMTSTLQDTVPGLVDSESWKLERIERTRFNRMTTTARAHGMKRAGFRAYKRVGVHDARQAPVCRELDGKIFLVDDLEHLPPSHPNCRCTIVPLTEEQYQDALRRGEIVGAPSLGGGP